MHILTAPMDWTGLATGKRVREYKITEVLSFRDTVAHGLPISLVVSK